MSAFIPAFRSKDPDDVEPKNFDASGRLAALGNPTVLSFDVFVDPTLGCADGALVISAIAYDPTSKRISFTWSGGTPEQTYCVTARLTLSPTWRIDQSGLVTICEH